MIKIGRHINGICLNDLEYLLSSDHSIKEFKDKDAARQFLIDHGISGDALEDSFVYQNEKGESI